MAQTCILVLGMHRSGTSALAGVLEKLGVYLGSELMQASNSNAKGHFENNQLYKVNEALLKQMGSKWDDILYNESLLSDQLDIEKLAETLEQEFQARDIFLIKDPRLAYLLPLYVRVLQSMGVDIKVIIPIRSPLEVANSLKERNGFSIEKGLLLWVYHFLLAEKYSRGLTRCFTKFDELIHDPQEVIQKLSSSLGINLQGRYQENQEEIAAFLEPDLKHHNISLETFPSLVPQVVHRCLQLSEQLNTQDVSEELDDLYRQVFDYQSLYYHSDIRDASIERDSMLHKLKTKEQELATLERQLNLKVGELRTKEKDLADQDLLIRELKGSTSWRITAPFRILSGRTKRLLRIIGLAFRLLWWLCTGKFSWALEALLPFYQNSVPTRVKRLVPNWARSFAMRQLKLGSQQKPVTTHKKKQNVKNHGADDYVRVKIDEPVAIIIPIFNALDDLKLCISRLLQYTPSSVEVILINDASTDKKINEFLETLSNIPQLRIFHNEKNLGFTETVNRGINLAGKNDVVLLNSDARVTPRWLEGIRNALSYDANIGTVTPMSDRAGAFSAPQIGNSNSLPLGIKEEDYAVAFRRHARGHYPAVPTGNGFCMYIRRACLDEVGGFDTEAFPRGYGEENDFCMRAGRFGWRHIIDDRTYVFHDRNKSFGSEKNDLIVAGRAIIDQRYPEYTKAIRVFRESPLISEARERATNALHELQMGKTLKPRILYVISTLTGGTPQTNRDLMQALSDDIEP